MKIQETIAVRNLQEKEKNRKRAELITRIILSAWDFYKVVCIIVASALFIYWAYQFITLLILSTVCRIGG